jgi:hypothetical protein
MPSTATVSLIDLFADDVLNSPYACFAELRDAGPAVWLERYGIWVCARYAEVHGALRDWETFSSAAGTGIDDLRESKHQFEHQFESWRPPSLIAEVDPPMHTRHRAVMNRVLSAKAMDGMREAFRASAEILVDQLTARGRIDAVKDMAEAYPLSVFPKAVGIEAVGLGSDGLDHLRAYGDMVFNAIGPRSARVEASMAEAAKVVPWITAHPPELRGPCRVRRRNSSLRRPDARAVGTGNDSHRAGIPGAAYRNRVRTGTPAEQHASAIRQSSGAAETGVRSGARSRAGSVPGPACRNIPPARALPAMEIKGARPCAFQWPFLPE